FRAEGVRPKSDSGVTDLPQSTLYCRKFSTHGIRNRSRKRGRWSESETWHATSLRCDCRLALDYLALAFCACFGRLCLEEGTVPQRLKAGAFFQLYRRPEGLLHPLAVGSFYGSRGLALSL